MSREEAEPAPRSERSSATGYAAVTLGLTAAGVGTAVAAGGPAGAIAAGTLSAWVIQAASFWRLDAALAARRDAVRPWAGGIAARLGGLAIAVVATAAAPAGPALPLAYGAALVVFLVVEAAWLSRRPWREPTRNRQRREDTRPDEPGES